MRTSDVVIAGAGIAGIASAWQIAATLGTTSAVLVDPRPPLSLTSDRPGANYRDWWPQPSMVALADRSIDLTEGLLTAGSTFAMDRRGYLYVTAEPATAGALASVRAERIEAGVAPDAAAVLNADEVRVRYPHLASDLVGAIHARRAGSLDTVGFGQAMLSIAQAAGVDVIRGEVIGTTVVAGRIVAVTVVTPDGALQIATERLVNAAGPFARRLSRRLGWDLDLETVLRQKVVIRDLFEIVPRDAPFTIGLDRTGGSPAGVHLKPDTAGAHDTLKLGWARDQAASEPVVDPPCPPEFPGDVLVRAATLVPGLGAYLDAPEIVAHDGGYYARSPDGLPLIGPHGPNGAYIVGGLAGFGSMMAAAAGELVARWVLDKPNPDMAAAFDPRRFAEAGRVASRAAGHAPAGEL